jgi:hypothetical protein
MKHPIDLVNKLRRKFGTIEKAAKHFNTRREMIYQAAHGGGSQKLRLAICLNLNINPLRLWPEKADDAQLWRLRMGLKDTESPWLTTDEAAAYLRFENIRTFRNYVSQNAIPHCVEPNTGMRRFNRQVLDQWLMRGQRA